MPVPLSCCQGLEAASVLSLNTGLRLSLRYFLFLGGIYCLADLGGIVMISPVLCSPLVSQVPLVTLGVLLCAHPSLTAAFLNVVS